MKVFWFFSIAVAVLASYVLGAGLATSTGAPQQAAVAAIALAVAVIPYVIARAIEGWVCATWRKEMLASSEKGNYNFKRVVEAGGRGPLRQPRHNLEVRASEIPALRISAMG